MLRNSLVLLASTFFATALQAQLSNNPFLTPIEAEEGIIEVNVVEFASLPEIDGVAARMMELVDEPGTGRIFVNDMTGPIYSVSYDGRTVIEYINIDDWGVEVWASEFREGGMQNFAFHPQFGLRGTPGYGKFYTWTDSSNTQPMPDYIPSDTLDDHDLLLHEWTAANPMNATYDGGMPREILRLQQPYINHNGGQIGFNPLATSGDADYGLLYVSVGDGGAGGDPLSMAQDLNSIFGKMLRIDPLGNNSPNGAYGIPASNPFVNDGDNNTLGEIYAYGIRNAQHFTWDSANGNMFIADIGQNIVEKISLISLGANLGWSTWEASYTFSDGTIDMTNPRSETGVTYPIAEWDHTDPVLQARGAASGLLVYRGETISQLQGKVLFAELMSGEIFYVDADNLPNGGQDSIRRVLLNNGSGAKTMLQLIQNANQEQGKDAASRADTRIDTANNQVFILNKGDSIIRRLAP
ncbi:PQQ-dependent sugar dehydrogenase [Haliea sp. AH-315-K21]|uniref:Glucose/Sorbosone dehydrogenase domain-containing protein n=1 Tax=SAR86 cluster bacterium TaxID=2030880 RepID=A0A2A5CDX6_9GAMM|nr:PQQ-dependent sugar dehydrogenase [Haliea sp. AH-315-K21]MBN4075735.1 PQQ-dependent sugar dehydrogenase [Gammaproteobacteria bacterium AH-315-E17]PCJ42059.1 MAG: hypothetical protein COA71_05555 [SAR86 cluster bacterium]